jgi:hypothetical protein
VHRAWARALYDELQPFSAGTVYVNYVGMDDDASRVGAAYGPNYRRLAAIKTSVPTQTIFPGESEHRSWLEPAYSLPLIASAFADGLDYSAPHDRPIVSPSWGLVASGQCREEQRGPRSST